MQNLQNQPSLLSYIRSVSAESGSQDLIAKYLEYLNCLGFNANPLFSHSVPMIFLLDYTSGNYLYMSNSAKSVLGYESAEYLNNGLEFTLDNYEKQQFDIYNTRIFPDRLSFLKTTPPEEHSQYIFTHNLQLKNSRKEYTSLLQRNVFIKSDEKGKPLVTLGIVVNINPFNNHNPIYQTIEKVNPAKPGDDNAQIVFKRAYYLNDEDKWLSSREKEILLWLAEGLTSKEIANKLHIAEATVLVHRKNMLEKTGALNVASLVAFGIRNRII